MTKNLVLTKSVNSGLYPDWVRHALTSPNSLKNVVDDNTRPLHAPCDDVTADGGGDDTTDVSAVDVNDRRRCCNRNGT